MSFVDHVLAEFEINVLESTHGKDGKSCFSLSPMGGALTFLNKRLFSKNLYLHLSLPGVFVSGLGV